MTPEEKVAHDALLEKVKETAKAEIETRGYQNKESVQSLLDTALQGLPMEALRAFDGEKLNTSIKNIAAELEKVKNVRMGIADQDDSKELIQRSINQMLFPEDGKSSDVELMMRSKGQSGNREVVLNIRAAANMRH
jgi:hypothetical protein